MYHFSGGGGGYYGGGSAYAAGGGGGSSYTDPAATGVAVTVAATRGDGHHAGTGHLFGTVV